MSGTQPWLGYMPSFQVIEDLYFVGTQPASTHVIDTGDGLIMLDSGYQHSLYLVLHNMYKLGLDPMDLKYIVHTHGHIDHCGATQALVALTGAKTFIGEADRDYVNGVLDLSWARETGLHMETFEPDVLLRDGDEITLGNTTLKAIATPGHTPGAMSFLFNVNYMGRALIAGLHGGAGLNSLQRDFLNRYGLSDACRTDYLSSMERLKELHVDVFLGNHVEQNRTSKKYQQLLAGKKDAFIDATEWGDFAEGCRKRLLALMEQEKLSL